MKKFKVYIKPFKLDPLWPACPKKGACRAHFDVRGYGRQKGQLELYAGR